MTGSELRSMRGQLGLTQEQLGNLLGVPGNSIARWERGEMTIEKPVVLRLAMEHLLGMHYSGTKLGPERPARIGRPPKKDGATSTSN